MKVVVKLSWDLIQCVNAICERTGQKFDAVLADAAWYAVTEDQKRVHAARHSLSPACADYHPLCERSEDGE
jgi:hypothetical protein